MGNLLKTINWFFTVLETGMCMSKMLISKMQFSYCIMTWVRPSRPTKPMRSSPTLLIATDARMGTLPSWAHLTLSSFQRFPYTNTMNIAIWVLSFQHSNSRGHSSQSRYEGKKKVLVSQFLLGNDNFLLSVFLLWFSKISSESLRFDSKLCSLERILLEF